MSRRLQLCERLSRYFREEMESGRVELGPGGDNGTAHLRGGRQFHCFCKLYLKMTGSAIDNQKVRALPQQRTGVS
jgi:hypothetical protein